MFKQKLIIYSVIFINLLFISKLSLEPLIISNINYSFISVMIIFAFIINELYEQFIKTNRKTKIYILLSALIIIPLIIFYQRQNLIYFIENNYIDNFKIILQCIKDDVDILFTYLKPFFAILVPIVTLICFKIYNYNNYSLLIFDSILLIGIWYGHSTRLVKESLFVFAFIFIYTLIISKYLNLCKQKIKNVNRLTNWDYVFILAFTFAFICNSIILFLPKDKPIITLDLFPRLSSDKGINTPNIAGSNLEPSITLANFNRFGYKSSGFSSDNKTLGGPIILGHESVMYVNSDRNLYLRGTTFDIYKENSWESSSLYMNTPVPNDDNSYTIRKFPNKSYLNLSDKLINIELIQDNLTNSVFLPLDSNSIFIDDTVHVEYNNFDVVRDKLNPLPYSVSYKVFKNADDEIDEFIKVKHKNLPNFMSYSNEPKTHGVTIVSTNLDSIALDAEQLDTLDIYFNYLQVPNNVPFSVYDLVYSIIEGASSSHEKVMRIKKYLYDNYTYTLDVSVVPENEEFVSYFLFKEKKGYCVYFSTAMTIMCRIAGVPARYVEGFAVKEDLLIETNRYLVKQDNAHAWCEVLAYPSDNIWVIADPLIPTTEEIKFDSSTPESSNENSTNNVPIEENKPLENTNTDADNINKYNNIIIYGIFVFLSYIALVLITNKRRYTKISNSNTMLDLYSYALNWLKELKITLDANESDRDILIKIKDNQLRDLIKKVVDLSYIEYYGNISQYSTEKKNYLETLNSIMKSKLGLPKYYLIKLFKFK